jgi:Tetratricopeptide repeat
VNAPAQARGQRHWPSAPATRCSPDHERVLGADGPETLASLNNLAAAYQNAGRTADAIALHEQTLAIMERVLGPDQPDT